MLTSLKRLELAQTHGTTSIILIFANDTITKVVSHDIYPLFQGQIFELLLSLNTTELAQKCETTLKIPGILTTFLFSKMQMITKLFMQICLHLYCNRRRVALVF